MHNNLFGVGKIFEMFLNEVFYVHWGYIYLIKNTLKAVIFWNFIVI